MAPRFREGSLLMFGLGKEAALVGDTTTGGGRILDGAPTYKVDGVPVAVTGSSVRCDVHGLTFILRGSAHVRVHGKEVALHGDLLACGHQIVVHGRHRMRMSAPTAAPQSEAGTNSSKAQAKPREPAAVAPAWKDRMGTRPLPEASREPIFSQFLTISLADGTPLAGHAFSKWTSCGLLSSGHLSSEGSTALLQGALQSRLIYAFTAPEAEAS